MAHIFGLGAMISLFLIYQQRNRKNILLCKLSADIFWIFHYFTLNSLFSLLSLIPSSQAPFSGSAEFLISPQTCPDAQTACHHLVLPTNKNLNLVGFFPFTLNS